MPVVEIAPPVTARPCAAVASLSSPQSTPPPARRRAALGVDRDRPSSRRGRSSRRRRRPRGRRRCGRRRGRETSSPRVAREARAAATTSSALRQRTITAGRRSTRPLWMRAGLVVAGVLGPEDALAEIADREGRCSWGNFLSGAGSPSADELQRRSFPGAGDSANTLSSTGMADTISFARGAPSLDIVDMEGLQEAAQRAFDERSRRDDRVRHERSATCRCASGSPSSTASSVDQVLVTNGSMQADAFLFAAAGAGPATR